MYVPKNFSNHNLNEIRQFIRENGFGILVSSEAEKVSATHLPLYLNEEGTTLTAHLSKANPQWKTFSEGKDVLVIFNGPHAYISSSWYNHENVPTWNYIAVHVYGSINILEGQKLHDALKSITDKYEKNSAVPVKLENMSEEYLRRQMNGIVGFEIQIKDIQASYKLSQNRDSVNHRAIEQQLRQRNAGDDLLIAEAMKKHYPQSKPDAL